MISSAVSRLIGAVVSVCVGWQISKLADAFLRINLDFGYLGDILGPAIGLVLGGVAAYWLYATGLRIVPINKKGLLKFFDEPLAWLSFKNGTHWVPPGCDIQVAPSPQETLFKEMPWAIISAQDRNTIYFGVPDDGAPQNGLQFTVLDAALYIKTPKAIETLRKAWLTEGRLFFSLLTEAAGVNAAKMLFDDFVELPRRGDPTATAKYGALERSLRTATFGTDDKRLFSNASVNVLRDNFGHFAEEAATWGLGKLQAQTPNIRQNPETDAAAASEVTRQAELRNLAARGDKVLELQQKMSGGAKMSPDLAALVAIRLDGQPVNLSHQKVHVEGLEGMGGDAAGRIVAEAVENRGGKHHG